MEQTLAHKAHGGCAWQQGGRGPPLTLRVYEKLGSPSKSTSRPQFQDPANEVASDHVIDLHFGDGFDVKTGTGFVAVGIRE